MNNLLRLDDGRVIKIVDSISDIEEERGACQDGFLLCRKLAAAVVWSTNPQTLTARCKACETDLAAVLWPSSTEDLTKYHLGEVKPKSAVVHVRELSSLELSRDAESQTSHARPAALAWPLIVAITLVLVALVCGKLLHSVIMAIMQDENFVQAVFLLYLPLVAFLSAFFLSIIVVGCFQLAGPISQLNTNSRYYSGKRPQTVISPTQLPHITVQCPIYKEGLWDVIDPTMQTVKQAIACYESQGGTASIVVNDDGMQILDEEGQLARKQYYHLHNIGWTARPANGQDGYVRVGAFKKASNMNYGMRASSQIEDAFEDLLQAGYSQDFETYGLAVAQVAERQPGLWCEGDVSLGELILLIDADTRVPEDCFLDAAKEFHESPELGILQHPSDVLIVSNNNFWEMAMAHFTRSNYFGTRYVVASGDATPFFGHNAFLRWSAMDSIANTNSGERQWWSESHVSEDFEMSLKLQTSGYITRMAGYSLNGFKEGVSLTVFDEISRWEKYAFGVSELIFNPFGLWLRKGPFTFLFRQYVAAPIDLAAKCSALIYMGTYFGIGLAWIFAVANYFLLGWVPYRIRGYYTDSLQILTAVCVIFGLKDAFVGPFVRYRVKEVTLFRGLLDSLKYFAITTIFLQGISMHVSRCLALHLLGRKMTWESTSKSLEESSVQSDLPMIWGRFKAMYIILLIMLCMVIALGFAVPENWRITSFGAVFPLLWLICWHLCVPVLMHNRSILNEIYR
ncbi:glycosyl transferase family group 2-domain-containing protein [Protomyces lactucae-debilis]|uniref:Glycosyl transferase family group 2-domain-containing protein n=1 Tax=Protomyces lactucae-debilis TaxID=2754530 RepID=A0A1Y2FHZ1_PROLT|nr:glycosyl transferase family group 2-domain-containing protein [Protomyces lactucae-debilis]ORY82425.1 glycosyl transferase family group 2-domain-containing protein [Protomyces lactucae-debilis]